MSNTEHHLKDKFALYFLFPFLLAIILSLAINLLYILNYINRLPYNNDIIKMVKNRDEETTVPIITKAKSLLNIEIQEKLKSLNVIEAYIRKHWINEVTKEKMMSFISKNSVNSVLLSQKEKYKEIVNKKNFSIFDYSTWYISPQKDRIDNDDDELIQSLYTLTVLNLLLRSFTEINGEVSQELNMFNIFIPKINLVYYYPFQKSEDYYKIFIHNKDKELYQKNCIDSTLSTPDYFYYYCEQFYVEATQNYKNKNIKLSISSPFIHQNGNNYISLCKTIKLIGNEVIICVLSMAQNMISKLNEINTMLSGYFFVMKANSDIPLYFPGNKDNTYKSSLLRYEFDKNSDYYIDELNESKDKFYSIKGEGTLMKNGIKITYKKYPINVYVENENINLLNLIYVVSSNTYDENMKSLQRNLIPNLILQFILFFILGSVLTLIVKYLIKGIAKRIVNPFKMVNQTLQGLKGDKTINYQNDISVEENKEEELKFDNENFSLVKSKKKRIYQEEENLQFEQQPDEVNSLLTKLISLKKLIKNTVINYDTQNILDLIFAREEFKNSSNDSGVLFCDSNIGNLSLKAEKYDKAIYHLSLSLSENENNKHNHVETRFQKILFAYRKYFSKLKKISKVFSQNNIVFSDFYSISKFHSLKSYKDTIEKYLEFLATSGASMQEKKNLLLAKLEKIRFLIKFEIQKDSSKQKIEEIKNEILKNKNSINELIKTIELNDEYIKNIIELVRTNKKNIIESIDSPIYILNQHLNYLIGKFYVKCGKQSKALNYFFLSKSNSPYPLIDAKTAKKSIKQIIKIITKLEVNNPLLCLHSNILKEELENYGSCKRQIAILVNTYDWSSSNELSQLVSQSKIAIMNIYDNVITSNDDFGLFLYINSLHIEIGMTRKEISNDNYIRELIEKCYDVDLIKNENEGNKQKLSLYTETFSLGQCINVMFEHLRKKANEEKNFEKWVIVICNDIGVKEAETLFEAQENNLNNEKLAFIRLTSRKNEGISTIRKKGIISFSHLEELKKLMKISGIVNRDKIYQNERYEKFDQCVNAGNDI